MSEKPAKGTRGFLLHNPVTQGFFFWVYDPADKSKFVDYDLCFEDLEIEIVDDHTSLYEGDRCRIGYSSKILGRKPAVLDGNTLLAKKVLD